MSFEYPLRLKRGMKMNIEGRNYTVHATDFYEKERHGVFYNRVGIETTVGTYFTVPIGSQIALGVAPRKERVVPGWGER